jgi:hypothetical protein
MTMTGVDGGAKVLNNSGIEVPTSTTFALARNKKDDAETRGGY